MIAVLSEEVRDAYLAHLRTIGISYVFGGKTALDLRLILDKLSRLFGIRKRLSQSRTYARRHV